MQGDQPFPIPGNASPPLHPDARKRIAYRHNPPYNHHILLPQNNQNLQQQPHQQYPQNLNLPFGDKVDRREIQRKL